MSFFSFFFFSFFFKKNTNYDWTDPVADPVAAADPVAVLIVGTFFLPLDCL